MKTPEMEVVRFSESDVIVASGNMHKKATAFGWGTGEVKDAGITYSNGTTKTKTLDDLSTDISFGYANSDTVFTNGDWSVTLGQLVGGGDADGLYDYVNGEYDLSDAGNKWVRRQ